MGVGEECTCVGWCSRDSRAWGSEVRRGRQRVGGQQERRRGSGLVKVAGCCCTGTGIGKMS